MSDQRYTDALLANGKLREERDRLREELNGLQRAHDQLGDQYAGVVAERDRLREALIVARADIAEWMRVHHGDDGSEAVLNQIDAALAKKEETT
jgi:hypothetical protein